MLSPIKELPLGPPVRGLPKFFICHTELELLVKRKPKTSHRALVPMGIIPEQEVSGKQGDKTFGEFQLYKEALFYIVAILFTLSSPTALENQVKGCPISSRNNASSPASHLLCSHLQRVQSHAHPHSTLSHAHPQSALSHFCLPSVQSHAHLQRFHLNSASRSVLLCSHHHHVNRSDHSRAVREKAIKATKQEKQIAPPCSSCIISSLKPILGEDGAP
ncbi:hypothetical protein HPG69_007406 [Diceros bicornis minor]|uniref:Uncharacterized protein n=1 Tax=Diceros bicornis minor TaxID=77932 RepID=A0A7J7F922_DICBM|nr:hypothetical protein HPG69_007406 [Diceros bicornis minor]